jgi:hypothetical protein
MAWTWQYQPAEAAAEPSGSFSTQSDAENWIGESWRELAAAGVSGVILLRDGERVYGPMPLA